MGWLMSKFLIQAAGLHSEATFVPMAGKMFEAREPTRTLRTGSRAGTARPEGHGRTRLAERSCVTEAKPSTVTN